jgi:protein-tyrosine-phosphatase
MAMRLLFVCTGNTCRSPMAASIARRIAEERGLTDLVVESAGTGAYDGSAASDGALLVAMEHAGDLAAHRARTLTRPMIQEADLVLTMGERHLARVEELGGAGKSFRLTDFASHGGAPSDVSDPFGGDLETYRATYEELEDAVRRALARVAPLGATGET